MIKTKEDLKHYLAADFERYGKSPTIKDWILHNEVWYIYHYIRHLRYVEYYQNCHNKRHPLFFWHFFRYKRLGFKLRMTIYPNTIGAGLRIYHAGDFIHVGPSTRIGSNCTLLPGVVFGNKHEFSKDNEIKVGDNCYFGLGAKIFGPLTIGENVTVGANSVVTKDMPKNTIIGGIPAKIIRNQNVNKN